QRRGRVRGGAGRPRPAVAVAARVRAPRPHGGPDRAARGGAAHAGGQRDLPVGRPAQSVGGAGSVGGVVMQAAVVEAPGTPPVLQERPLPTRGEGGVVVAVSAAPIVPLDLLCASGASYFGVPSVPYVPGVQGVGVVAEGTAGLVR